MMINPTKQQAIIRDKFDKEVTPWLTVDKKSGKFLINPNAPIYIKVLYDLYINEGNWSCKKHFEYYQKHQHLFR